MKAPKNKPMGDDYMTAWFDEAGTSFDSVEEFADANGYRWSRSEKMWVDDGSLEMEWADRVNDERRDKELLK